MRRIITIAAAVVLLAGCAATAPQTAPAGGGAKTLTVTAPADGADVAAPFDLEFTSNEEIGPPESGKHHVHVFVDGKTDDYTVVTSSPFKIEGLAPGMHTVGVTLQFADHSPAGAAAEIKVNVTGSAPATSSGGPGGY